MVVWEVPSTWPFCILFCSYISDSPFLPCLLAIFLSRWGDRGKQKAIWGCPTLFTQLHQLFSPLHWIHWNLPGLSVKWSSHFVTFFLPSTIAFNLQHPLISSSYAVFKILHLLPWSQLNQPHVPHCMQCMH